MQLSTWGWVCTHMPPMGSVHLCGFRVKREAKVFPTHPTPACLGTCHPVTDPLQLIDIFESKLSLSQGNILPLLLKIKFSFSNNRT